MQLSRHDGNSKRDPSPFRRVASPQRRLRVLTDPTIDLEHGPGRWLRQACETDTIEWFSLRSGDQSDRYVVMESEVPDGVPLRIHPREDNSVILAVVQPLSWRRAIANREVTQGYDRNVVYDALVLSGVAEAVEADVFVTSRAYLLSELRGGRANVFGIDEGLALVGLFQRLSFEHVTWQWQDAAPRSSCVVSASLSLEVAVERHVRSFEPWIGHGVAVAQRTGLKDPDGVELARGFRSRLASAIRALDEVRGRHQSGQGELGGDWQADVERVLMFVWSAFDVLAHAADLQFNLESPLSNIGWQKREWRRRLGRSSDGRSLAATVEAVLPTITAVFALRNGIHHSPRREGGYGDGHRTESILLLTSAEMQLFRHLEGTPSWSRGDSDWLGDPRGKWLVAPVPFVEHVLRMALDALEELLAEMVHALGNLEHHSMPHIVENEEDRRRLAALVGLEGLTAN